MLLSQRSLEYIYVASLGDLDSVLLLYSSILLPLPQCIDYCSFYLVLLSLSSEFYSFPHIDLVHILLYLYVSISLWEVMMEMAF